MSSEKPVKPIVEEIREILEEESDFEVALDLVEDALRNVEPWRLERADFFSIMDILALKKYHYRFHGNGV